MTSRSKNSYRGSLGRSPIGSPLSDGDTFSAITQQRQRT